MIFWKSTEIAQLMYEKKLRTLGIPPSTVHVHFLKEVEILYR